MSAVIKIENLSKAYQLGEIGTGTISRDLERFWARMRGKEDPFLKIGEVNDRAVKGKSDVVWSLKDLNFDIEQGDAVGIIGRNGAGKSTLLKILSRVTAPTSGSVKVKGRIASLLEVGTGFHPELSGRENIYLNGAILGMRKAEIKRKFDEIVDFSGVERYIDTPVKRYSSGMYVRLAFAVAAHLESDIMIVDEVLAVGDAEFQKKCLGKMNDVSKGEGRTVLFVSHNMAAIEALCNQSILLNSGIIIGNDVTEKIINEYLYSYKDELLSFVEKLTLSPELILNFKINTNNLITIGENLTFEISINSTECFQLTDLSILIYNEREIRVSVIDLRNELYRIKNDLTGFNIKGTINSINLIPGTYKVKLYIKSHLYHENTAELVQFYVRGQNVSDIIPYSSTISGIVKFDYSISDLITI
jgi:lipopolysaccharide transport system ATP-binding protein